MAAIERRTLTPLVVLNDNQGRQEVVLDTLNAAYEGLAFQSVSYDSFQVTETEAGQPDAIAYRFYGAEELWWIICTFNGIVDPYTEIVAGVKLRVPRLDEVYVYINESKSRTEKQTRQAQQVGTFGEL